MTSTCPECGAHLLDDATCQSLFDSFLALEFSDPAYGAVHLLTVACFMVQHGRYSDEALAWTEQTLRLYLEGGLTPAQIRREAARQTRPGLRAWKVGRPPGAPPPARVAWSMTIADLAASAAHASSYCAAVERWARLTLQEMQPLLK
jgi:hypothetical protein